MLTKKAQAKKARQVRRAAMVSNFTVAPIITEGKAPETMTWKECQNDPRFFALSEGNAKLKPTKTVKFLIWNLPCIITCPWATSECIGKCYALAAERYTANINARYKRLYESGRVDFIPRMIWTIRAFLSRPSYREAKKVVIRIHESGDFYSHRYVEKWVAIANAFKDDPRLVFMGYTKSVRYFVGVDIPENMTVRFSIWDDTDPAEIALAKALGLPTYSAVECFTDETDDERCRCADCGTCFHCFVAKYHRILCEIH